MTRVEVSEGRAALGSRWRNLPIAILAWLLAVVLISSRRSIRGDNDVSLLFILAVGFGFALAVATVVSAIAFVRAQQARETASSAWSARVAADPERVSAELGGTVRHSSRAAEQRLGAVVIEPSQTFVVWPRVPGSTEEGLTLPEGSIVEIRHMKGKAHTVRLITTSGQADLEVRGRVGLPSL